MRIAHVVFVLIWCAGLGATPGFAAAGSAAASASPFHQEAPTPTYTPIPRGAPQYRRGGNEEYHHVAPRTFETDFFATGSGISGFDSVFGLQAAFRANVGRFQIGLEGHWTRAAIPFTFGDTVVASAYGASLGTRIGLGSERLFPEWFEPFVLVSAGVEMVDSIIKDGARIGPLRGVSFLDFRAGGGLTFRPSRTYKMSLSISAGASYLAGESRVQDVLRYNTNLSLDLPFTRSVGARIFVDSMWAGGDNRDRLKFSKFVEKGWDTEKEFDVDYVFSATTFAIGLVFKF